MGRASIRGAGKRICPDLVTISGRYSISIDIYKADISLQGPLLGIDAFSASRCRRLTSVLKVDKYEDNSRRQSAHPSIKKVLLCECASPLIPRFRERVSPNQSPTLRHRKKVFDFFIGDEERGAAKGYKAYSTGAAVGMWTSWSCVLCARNSEGSI